MCGKFVDTALRYVVVARLAHPVRAKRRVGRHAERTAEQMTGAADLFRGATIRARAAVASPLAAVTDMHPSWPAILAAVCCYGRWSSAAAAAAGNHVYTAPLDDTGRTAVYWTVDYADRSVKFEAHFDGGGPADWLALGFSGRGNHTDADFCLAWTDWKGVTGMLVSGAPRDDRSRRAERAKPCLGSSPDIFVSVDSKNDFQKKKNPRLSVGHVVAKMSYPRTVCPVLFTPIPTVITANWYDLFSI